MAILKRPMFSKGGSTNGGIMDGLNRKGYDQGTNWEDLAEAYSMEGSGQNNIYWTGVDEPPMGEIESSDWLPNWYKRQDPKYKHFKEYVTETGGVPEGRVGPIAPGEEGGPGYVGPVTELPSEIPPEIKKPTGDIDDISVSDLNKKYLKMMAPGMQKRMMNDALAAASTALGESTGDTKQDIANAITAAAAGMGGTKDIYDKVSMLTLSGEIQKDIEKSKVVKKSNYEYLYDKMTSPYPKDRAFAKSILKQDKDLGDFVEQHGTATGYRLFVGKTMPDIKGTFAGDEKSIKALKTEELGDGKYYLAPPKDTFVTIKGGKITKEEPGLV